MVLRRTDGKGEYRLMLRFDPARMDATLKLDEPAGGALERLLHYPGLGALQSARASTDRVARSALRSRRGLETCAPRRRAPSI